MKFDDRIKEQLQYYVYRLTNPITGKTFYIGKGKDDRIFAHISETLKKSKDELEDDLKLQEIKSIKDSGKHVILEIIRHGLTQEEAFEVEAALIDAFDLRELKNKIRGKDTFRGIMTVDEIVEQYSAEEIESIKEKVILININSLYKKEMSEAEVYEAVRSSWILGKKKDKAQLVFAVYRGIVKQVYKIVENSWKCESEQQIIDKNGKIRTKRRFSFKGIPLDDNDYKGKSVKSYWRKGSQNPIKYSWK